MVDSAYSKFTQTVSLENAPEACWLALLEYFEALNNTVSTEEPWKVKDKKTKSEMLARYIFALVYPLPFIYLFEPVFYQDLADLIEPISFNLDRSRGFESFMDQLAPHLATITNSASANRDKYRREKQQATNSNNNH